MIQFSKCLEEYLQYSETHKRTSSYKRDLTAARRLLKEFGARPISEITLRDVEAFQNKRALEVKPATVNRDFETLRHMFTKAVEWEYVSKNPARLVKLLKTPPGRIRYLSFEERDRLLLECAHNSMLHAAVIIALETGMRRGELMRLKWEDISFETQVIYLYRTKSNEARAIPISNRLLVFLRRLYSERVGEFVFEKPDGRPYGNWRRAFESACRRAGIKSFRFHDLRHTFASYLVMANVNIRVVQELMRLKSLKMVMRYTHVPRGTLFDAVNEINKGGKDYQFNPYLDVQQSRRVDSNHRPTLYESVALSSNLVPHKNSSDFTEVPIFEDLEEEI